MNLLERCADRILVYDGSKGVMLQMKGLSGGDSAEEWNLSHADKVSEVHREYIEAGADIIQTNTFCANAPSLKNHRLEDKLYEINYEGAKLALDCAKENVMVAASVGPTGLFFEPAGDMTFESMSAVFRQQLKPLRDAGISIVNFETFTDLNEMRAAIVAARETGGFEVIASMTFDGERTMSGNTPAACAAVCAGMGVSLMGANCSGGPESLLEPIRNMHETISLPLSAKPNAGLPEMEDGVAVFKQKPEDFSRLVPEFAESGVRLIGGCCGSGPEHIKALRAAVDRLQRPQDRWPDKAVIASAYEAVEIEAVKTAEMRLDIQSVLDGLRNGDYYCLMDTIPMDAGEADAVVLDFGQMELFFDMWSFTATLGMFVKKPVIVKGGTPELIQGFLRYYAGRAGIMQDAKQGLTELYGAVGVER